MIIFTVTNKTTSQVYVGSTRNSLLDQWEKMVAAAEQNLDYPLYQEIRAHGKTLSARSLKGYKTSTIKIQPKKKTRARKSSLEKEMANIFTEVDFGLDDFDDIVPEQTQNISESAPESSSVAIVVDTRQVPSQNDSIASLQPEQPAIRQERGSQVNALVQMSNICLSDDFSAQLEAIQAAANGVLAGDSSAVELLNCQTPEPVEITVEMASIGLTGADLKPATAIEPDSREQRIRAAIARHRKARAQKTSDSLTTERQMIEQQLAELTARATNNATIAAVA